MMWLLPVLAKDATIGGSVLGAPPLLGPVLAAAARAGWRETGWSETHWSVMEAAAASGPLSLSTERGH